MPIVPRDPNKRSAKTPSQSAADPAEAPPNEGERRGGYGTPPKDKQFKKGQSGNPKGRPKGAKGTSTIVRELMTAQVEVRTSVGIKKMTRMQAAIHKLSELAMKGNARALALLIGLYSEAVPDQVAVAGGGGGGGGSNPTATDEAIIAEFKAKFMKEEGDE